MSSSVSSFTTFFISAAALLLFAPTLKIVKLANQVDGMNSREPRHVAQSLESFAVADARTAWSCRYHPWSRELRLF